MLSDLYLTNKDESEQPMHTINTIICNTLIIFAALFYGSEYVETTNDISAQFAKTDIVVTQLSETPYTEQKYIRDTQPETPSIQYKHGDVSWLPILAAQAGWPKKTWPKLSSIILRESGGCPNRKGGDAVDSNCNITHVTEWSHRSDTGLLQINGLNYDTSRNKWAAVCTELNICEQELLLDPLTNLKAGKLLYDLSGWGPWDPCTWGPKFAKRCKQLSND